MYKAVLLNVIAQLPALAIEHNIQGDNPIITASGSIITATYAEHTKKMVVAFSTVDGIFHDSGTDQKVLSFTRNSGEFIEYYENCFWKGEPPCRVFDDNYTCGDEPIWMLVHRIFPDGGIGGGEQELDIIANDIKITLNKRESALFDYSPTSFRNKMHAAISELAACFGKETCVAIDRVRSNTSSVIQLTKAQSIAYKETSPAFRQQVYDAAMTIAGHLGGYGIGLVDNNGYDLSSEYEELVYNF
jgi:hypothetical protein